MTKSTDTRQLKLLIEGILRANEIDSLKLEVDLFSGIKRLLESETPARTREQIVEEVRTALGKGAEKKSLDEQIETQFKRFPLNWLPFPESEKDGFRRFLKEQEGTLEQFINWWTQDEWRLAHPPQRLDKIMIMWPQAFQKKAEVKQSMPTFVNGRLVE